MKEEKLDIEVVRKDLIGLITELGGDKYASECVAYCCDGWAPDRSTFGRFRRGEGNHNLMAICTAILRACKAQEIALWGDDYEPQ